MSKRDLVMRERYSCNSRWGGLLMPEAIASISIVMGQKSLRGIRDRAERRPTTG